MVCHAKSCWHSSVSLNSIASKTSNKRELLLQEREETAGTVRYVTGSRPFSCPFLLRFLSFPQDAGAPVGCISEFRGWMFD